MKIETVVELRLGQLDEVRYGHWRALLIELYHNLIGCYLDDGLGLFVGPASAAL